MSNKFSKFKRGFSLVELIVAITLILIMTGVLLMNQNNNKAQEDVDIAARQVVAQLRALQNEALSGKQIGGLSVCSFNFKAAESDSNSYDVTYDKCSGGQIESLTTQLNSGKKNVTISSIPTTISFSSPRGEVASAKITFISNDNTATAYVLVCGSGNIFDTKNSSEGC